MAEEKINTVKKKPPLVLPVKREEVKGVQVKSTTPASPPLLKTGGEVKMKNPPAPRPHPNPSPKERGVIDGKTGGELSGKEKRLANLKPFQMGNQEGKKNAGKEKITEKKIKQALVKIVDMIGAKLEGFQGLTIDDIHQEAFRILIKDGLRSPESAVRLKYAEMMFADYKYDSRAGERAAMNNTQNNNGEVNFGNKFQVLVVKTEKSGDQVMDELKQEVQ